PHVAAAWRDDLVNDARRQAGQRSAERCQFGFEHPHIEGERAIEFAESGGMASALLRIPVSPRRPAFAFEASYSAPSAAAFAKATARQVRLTCRGVAERRSRGEVSCAARRRG